MEVFGEEKMEFHNLVSRLQEHLLEVEPIELHFEVVSKKSNNQVESSFYELPVFVHSES